MVYEGVLLFGVLFAAELAFDLATQNLNPALLRNWDHLYLFVVLGLYFTYFWGHGGQTLPMKTWHIRLTSTEGARVSFKQACLRYALAWMWFLPGLVIWYAFDVQRWTGVIMLLVGLCAWALLSKLDANGQFLHDRLSGTLLIAVPKDAIVSDSE